MKKKRIYNIVPTSDPELNVRISGWLYEKKSSRLYGKLIDKEGREVDKKSHSIVIKPDDDLHTVENILAYRIHSSYIGRRNSRSADERPKVPELESNLEKAFQALKVENFSWADSTFRQYSSFFKRNFIPFFKRFEGEPEISLTVVDAFKAQLIEKTIRNRNHMGSLINAASLADAKLGFCSIIYDAVRIENPDLPDIHFPETIKRKRWSYEQIKALKLEVLLGLRQQVEELVYVNPRLALAIALMESGALRTAESVAVSSDEILWFADTAIVVVCYQITSKGKRTEILKTENSYRIVPLDSWGSMVVGRCLCQIAGDHQEFLIPSEVSKSVKSMLMKAGVSQDEEEGYRRHMDDQPELDSSGVPLGDLSAYVLRRSRASIWANYCGLQKCEIDNLLGHKVSARQKLKINNSEAINRIIIAYQRFDLNRLTAGEECVCYVELGGENKRYSIEPFQKYILKNDTEKSVHIIITCSPAEPGERIIMELPHKPLASNKFTEARKQLRREGTCIGGVSYGQSTKN